MATVRSPRTNLVVPGRGWEHCRIENRMSKAVAEPVADLRSVFALLRGRHLAGQQHDDLISRRGVTAWWIAGRGHSFFCARPFSSSRARSTAGPSPSSSSSKSWRISISPCAPDSRSYP